MPKTSLAVLFIMATLLSTASANIIAANHAKVHAEYWTNVSYHPFPDGYLIGRACRIYRDSPYGQVQDIYFWVSNSSPRYRTLRWQVRRNGGVIYENSSSTWLYGTEIRNQVTLSMFANDRLDLGYVGSNDTLTTSIFLNTGLTACWY